MANTAMDEGAWNTLIVDNAQACQSFAISVLPRVLKFRVIELDFFVKFYKIKK